MLRTHAVVVPDRDLRNKTKMYIVLHSKAARNLTKVWKTEMGPSQGDK